MDEDATVIGGSVTSSRASSLLADGILVGDYRIVRLLGVGAMGQVYEVEQIRMGRRYALKLLPPELSQDAGFKNRFDQETRTLSGLDHPNIVQIVYAGEAMVNGIRQSYLVMELLEPFVDTADGGGPLPLARIREVLSQVLDALCYAHARGIVHRDLKPPNLLQTQSGDVKVSDFGVAQVVGSDFMRSVVEYTMARTAVGNAPTQVEDTTNKRASGYVGTLHYMAPEVVGGTEATAESDLYAVGVIAYELLTGRKPIGRIKDPSKLNPQATAGWDDWVLRLLEPEPADRGQLATALSLLPQLSNPQKNISEIPLAKSTRVATPPPIPKVTVSKKANQMEVGKPFTLRIANNVKLDMLWIPPGEFTMGSPEEISEKGFFGFGKNITQRGEEGRFQNEGPQTQVKLTKGFWLGKTPVTQGQWQALMGNNPSHFKQSGLNAPVESVSWNDAMEFARRLTERERAAGRLPAGYEYTLPSEAQWEYAARGGTTTRWSFGDNESQLGDYGWFSGNSGNQPRPVGQKRANPWGLHDVHGNVWEWTRSWLGNYPGGSVTDYEGPNSGSFRVLRGGSWWSSAANTRSAFRSRGAPGGRNYGLGFRLALSSVP